MKVEIINPEVVENLYKNHGIFACTCYGTHEKYAKSVGEKCEKTGHMSGSRCEYIKFRVSEIDRGTAEQCLRHELGVNVPYELQDNYSFSDYSELVKDVSPDQIVKNMASFRYIDKEGFKYVIPKMISSCPDAKEVYEDLMGKISVAREQMKETLIKQYGEDEMKAVVEAINFVLPRATTTEFVIGFTPEALIHFSHKRLCTRAQEFIRQFAIMMKAEVQKYNDKFAEELMPHCKHLLWCPEGSMSCDSYPTKDKLIELIQKSKNKASECVVDGM